MTEGVGEGVRMLEFEERHPITAYQIASRVDDAKRLSLHFEELYDKYIDQHGIDTTDCQRACKKAHEIHSDITSTILEQLTRDPSRKDLPAYYKSLLETIDNLPEEIFRETISARREEQAA